MIQVWWLAMAWPPRTGAGAPAWGDAGVIVPWTVSKMYGDTAVPDRHFGAMTRWMDFLERVNPDYLRARELGNSYNDWLAPGDDDTPHEHHRDPHADRPGPAGPGHPLVGRVTIGTGLRPPDHAVLGGLRWVVGVT